MPTFVDSYSVYVNTITVVKQDGIIATVLENTILESQTVTAYQGCHVIKRSSEPDVRIIITLTTIDSEVLQDHIVCGVSSDHQHSLFFFDRTSTVTPGRQPFCELYCCTISIEDGMATEQERIFYCVDDIRIQDYRPTMSKSLIDCF